MTTPALWTDALAKVIEPYSQATLAELKAIKTAELKDSHVQIALTFGFPAEASRTALVQQIQAQVLPHLPPQTTLNLTLDWKVVGHKVQQPALTAVHGIKNIIAVASGKGGVGKSTVSANLALALQHEGARVGLLDADIYGPSQPHLMGAQTSPTSNDKKTINPVVSHGIQTMSVGYLVDAETPVIWRGPMVSGALQQLLNDTQWDNLDYLIVDLPPGTGDIQLTLAQKIPVSGSVIVTTPQDLSLIDVRRAMGMFAKVNIPVFGIIENMSVYHCPQCGHQEAIFGEAGGDTLAQEFHTTLLGRLPLAKLIREDADLGIPTVARDPEGAIAKQYREIALRTVAKLSLQPKNYAVKLPKVVVESQKKSDA